MALPTLLLDTTGNTEVADGQRISWDCMLNKAIPSATQPYFLAGTGAPTFAATKGSIYTDIAAAGANLRLYVNTTGSTVWAAVTSA